MAVPVENLKIEYGENVGSGSRPAVYVLVYIASSPLLSHVLPVGHEFRGEFKVFFSGDSARSGGSLLSPALLPPPPNENKNGSPRQSQSESIRVSLSRIASRTALGAQSNSRTRKKRKCHMRAHSLIRDRFFRASSRE